MSTRQHLHSVVATLQPVVQGVAAENLTAPAPCTDFDVRAVANQMVLAQTGRDPEWSAT